MILSDVHMQRGLSWIKDSISFINVRWTWTHLSPSMSFSPPHWSTGTLPPSTASSVLIPPNPSPAPGLCCRKGGSQPANLLLLPCPYTGWITAWLQEGLWDKDTTADDGNQLMRCSFICKCFLWQYRYIGVKFTFSWETIPSLLTAQWPWDFTWGKRRWSLTMQAQVVLADLPLL